MSIELLNLNDRSAFRLDPSLAAPQVWTRASWSLPWSLRADLVPTQCTWSAFPTISTATLHYRYGWVVLPGAITPTRLERITARGYWILIGYPADDQDPGAQPGTLPYAWWLGYAEHAIDGQRIPAGPAGIATGTQTVPCYGLERLWDEAAIDSTVGQHVDAERWRRFGQVAMPFNGQAFGNRSESRRKLDDTRNVTAFAFSRAEDVHRKWSTKDICEYLTAFHAPTFSRILPPVDSDPAAEIPWRVSGIAELPDWDAPTVRSDGRMVGDVLRELIQPARMTRLAFNTEANWTENGPVVSAVQMQFGTLLTDRITVPKIDQPLPYTEAGIAILCASDPLTTVKHTIDASDVVDQVVVQGPREVSVCTLTVAAGQFKRHWSEAQQGDYLTGASELAGWAGWSQSERSAANDRERAFGFLEDVFRDLVLDNDYQGEAAGDKAAFPDSLGLPPELPESFHVPFLGALELLPDLPLFYGTDYKGNPADVVEEEGLAGRRSILVTLKNPDGEFRDPAHLIGTPGLTPERQLRAFRLEVKTHNDPSPTLQLIVRGGPQLMIANLDGNAADGDNTKGYDYTTMEATVALRGDRRPNWRIPSDDALVNVDASRRRVYTLDTPTYEMVYIAEETVVAIDEDRARLRSTGGMLRDPLPALQAAAKLIHNYQHAPRNRVVITTARRLHRTRIGSIVRQVDKVGLDVKAPITEVRIDSPIDSNNVTQSIIIAAQRIDFLAALSVE